MSEPEVQQVAGTAPEGAGLSQIERITNAFIAPSKTFEDIGRGNKSWWLPFVLFVVVGTALWATVNQKVGWNQIVENGLRVSPKQAEQLEKLPAEQRESQLKISAYIQEGIWGLGPVWVLLMNLIAAGVLLGTINFGFGGKATYGKVLSVSWYAGLPGLIKLALGAVGLWAGLAPEGFMPGNPAGTNPGFYMTPPDVPPPLWAVYSALDIIGIWTLVLFSIGLAKVAGTKPSTGYIAVFGWWLLSLAVGVGFSAAFS
jgi:hypothetical protein